MSQATAKTELDAVSMDPFDEEILPFDVHQHILQYLNGSDLLKASEVSRRWNQKVESAKGFIEKIKLTIASIPPQEGDATQSKTNTVKDMLTRDDIAAVLNSQRNYVNVEIRFVLLDSLNLRQKLLQKFAGSIKYMACDVYIDDDTPDITFPNLTQLQIIGPYLNQFKILLSRMPAVAMLRVGTLTIWDRDHIMRHSMSLREVRYKRARRLTFPTPLLNESFLKPTNQNIRFIKE